MLSSLKRTTQLTHLQKKSSHQKRTYKSATTTTSLSNGIAVASSARSTPLSTIGLILDAGAVYEKEHQLGATRFMEKSLPFMRIKDGRTLAQVVQQSGGVLRSYSTRDRVVVLAEGVGSEMEMVGTVLGDVLGGEVEMSKEDVERVREGMKAEYGVLSETFDEDFITEQVHSAAFQGTSLANSIYGSSENFDNLDLGLLKEYKDGVVTGCRVAAVSAGIDADKFAQSISNSALSNVSEGTADSVTQPNDFIGSEIRIRDDTFHNAQLAVSLHAPGRSDPDYYAYMIFQALVGSYDHHSGGSNNIISQLGEDLSLSIQFALGFKTLNYNYKNVGVFSVLANVQAENLDDYTYILATRLQHIAKSTSSTDLIIAKNMVKTALANQVATNSGLVDFIGDSILTNRQFKSLEEVFAQIDAVTLKDLKASLKTRYDDCDPVIVGFGPLEDLPDYTFLRSRLGSPLW